MLGFYNYTVIVTYIGGMAALAGVMLTLSRSDLKAGLICLIIAGFCDMFDGAIAKTRKRTDDEKRFGIQIDSLADMISFGILPACIGYAIGLQKPWQMAILLAYALAALIRLAYFNVIEENRQKEESGRRKEYPGLPVTVSSLIMGLTAIVTNYLCPAALQNAYLVMLAVTGTLFLSPIRVKKLSLVGNLLLALAGLAIIALLPVIRNVFF